MMERMSADGDPVGVLDRALTECGRLIGNVTPDQAGLPTPCASFDLRALINHIVYDVRMFTETSLGNPRPPAGEDVIGDDWSGAYDAAAAGLLAVWRRPGALEGTITLPFGDVPVTWRLGQQIVDVVVHG